MGLHARWCTCPTASATFENDITKHHEWVAGPLCTLCLNLQEDNQYIWLNVSFGSKRYMNTSYMVSRADIQMGVYSCLMIYHIILSLISDFQICNCHHQIIIFTWWHSTSDRFDCTYCCCFFLHRLLHLHFYEDSLCRSITASLACPTPIQRTGRKLVFDIRGQVHMMSA